MKIVKNKRTFEPIPINDKKSVYTMKIRCTCIQLENGNYEYLISNLPLKNFSALDLRELYWKRWSIETSFRRLKYALSLVYLHSVNRELIIQEVYAKLIMYNFASLLHAFATEEKKKEQGKKKRKYEYKISFEDVLIFYYCSFLLCFRHSTTSLLSICQEMSQGKLSLASGTRNFLLDSPEP